jgi:hypothetical protein
MTHTAVPIFYEVVTLRTRLAPEEAAERLRRTVRRPRRLMEWMRGEPVPPPAHPHFIGTVADGRFRLVRLADAPDDLAHSQIRRPAVRGRITAVETGADVRVVFFDPALTAMTLGFSGLSVTAAIAVLVQARGWPVFQPEHLILVAGIAAPVWFCRRSLRTDVTATMNILERLLK